MKTILEYIELVLFSGMSTRSRYAAWKHFHAAVGHKVQEIESKVKIEDLDDALSDLDSSDLKGFSKEDVLGAVEWLRSDNRRRAFGVSPYQVMNMREMHGVRLGDD